MKTVTQIKAKIKQLEADERYEKNPALQASLEVNTTLALTQIVLETELATLRWVLKDADDA